MKKLKNNWEQYIIYLKYTNNKMLCIRQYSPYIETYSEWVYFSQKNYGSIKDAIRASEKYMKLHF